ncbi:GGDEF domain-containing protein [Acidipila sp. EB88]|uniref:GGDEF domain-containing protein n=1 Tax=Acidipila sp. EB88 TaxID=2305226 RepID=UPI00131513FE|nr:GGDEF domain-containing protein [Acidipila sp. EB88]
MKQAVPGPPAAKPRPGRFPTELEMEFAEMQATVPSAGTLPALLGAGLIFHVLLIAERSLLHLSPTTFAVRGAPITLLLLVILLLPNSFRVKDAGRGILVLFSTLLVVALLAAVPFNTAQQLLPMQTGVGLLMLFVGWLTVLPRHWAIPSALLALCADAVSLLLGPASHSVGNSVIFESIWAPGFAAALLILLASVRHNEARRDFLLLRQAAFAGVPGEATPEGSRHLDPETGVGNRLAFDMRFRAAWDQAASRRSAVALLFFSIDNFAEQKRDLGFRFSELLQGQVANLLKDSLRRSDDMVARFDNHHFVVMLPGVGTDGATQIAERLRGCVEEMPVFAGQRRHYSTVTVGAASMRAKRGTPRESLIDSAIQALEQARSAGANTVCVEGRGCIPRMS